MLVQLIEVLALFLDLVAEGQKPTETSQHLFATGQFRTVPMPDRIGPMETARRGGGGGGGGVR